MCAGGRPIPRSSTSRADPTRRRPRPSPAGVSASSSTATPSTRPVVCDLKGRVLAHGRPEQFPRARRATVADQRGSGRRSRPRTERSSRSPTSTRPRSSTGGAVATYATADPRGRRGRRRGHRRARHLLRLGSPGPGGGRRRPPHRGGARDARAAIVDAHRRVLAASDGRGVLSETLAARDRRPEDGPLRRPPTAVSASR